MTLRIRAALAVLILTVSAPPLQAIDLTSVIPGIESALKKDVSANPSATAPGQAIFQPSAIDPAANAARLDSLTTRLDTLRSSSIDEAAARNGVTEDDTKARLTLLYTLKLNYERLSTAMKNLPAAQAALKALQENPDSAQPLVQGKPPFDVSVYDRAFSSVEDLNSSLELNDSALQNAHQAQNYAQTNQQSAEGQFKSARADAGPSPQPAVVWRLENLALAGEVARTDVIFRQLTVQSLTAENQTLRIQLDEARKTARWIAQNLQFTADDYQTVNKSLDATTLALQKKLDSAEKSVADLEGTTAPKYNDPNLTGLAAQLLIQQKNQVSTRLEGLQTALGRASVKRQLWDLRYRLLNGKVVQESMPSTIDSLGRSVGALEAAQSADQKLMLAVQKRLSNLNSQMVDEAQGPGHNIKLRMVKTASAELADIDADASDIADLLQLTQITLHEFKSLYKAVPVTEKVAGLWRTKTAEILNTALWTSGDYTVHLKSLLGALVILLLGMFGSHRMTRFVMNRVRNHIKIDETSAASISRFILSLMGLVCFLIALRLAGIPLTAFAFLGGAIAIAIGFGAQTLFTNVISGIMLAMHRPFRIGDTLELDGIVAEVKEIGTRSTRMRTADGKDVIMPNSKLVDSRLVNWTLSDFLNRRTISIGLSYDCNPDEAAKLMLNVVRSNSQILAYPEPTIYFSDFGNSALSFTIYYWLNLRVVSGLKVDSDIRFALFRELNAAGVGIPYPQMDLHVISVPGREGALIEPGPTTPDPDRPASD